MTATIAPSSAELGEPLRVRLGASAETPADLLLRLARDPAVTVRAAVAMNGAAPAAADHVLAADADERVRAVLARKLAALVPQLPASQGSELREQVLQTLSALVEDEAVRIRAILADILKEMPGAPRALILRLAHDSAIPVSDPVIRLSPVLTQEDLLALLAAPPNPAVATAIAGREGLSEPVCDAIAATADTDAIRVLLGNHAASIREATLDELIKRCSGQPSWHQPLVRRPGLSPRAARALSQIVAVHLLQMLASRADLDLATSQELRRRLAAQLMPAPPSPTGGTAQEPSMTEALRLRAARQLDEAALLTAARRGQASLCAAMLAVAAGVPMASVERAAMLRSPKSLISLVWKAGWTMRAGHAVQGLLGQLPPESILPPGSGGRFPLSIDEMEWQLAFLRQGAE